MNPQILYDIFEKVNQKKEAGVDIIKLNVGEPEQPPPKIISKIIAKSIDNGRTTYGPSKGDLKLRQLLAVEHKVNPDNIIIGPGSKFLIYAILRLLYKKGRKQVFIPQPSWSAFTLMLKELDFPKITYLKTSEESNWKINLLDLKREALNEKDALIITTPDNPTSVKYEKGELQELDTLSSENKFLLLKDCAYQALSFEEVPNKDETINLDNTIEIHSFSKKFCMTGFRLGYLIAKEETINDLSKFMQMTITSVPLFIQDAAIELLEKYSSYPRKIAAIYQKRADLIGKMLEKKRVTFVKPDAGFYIFANVHTNSEELCLNLIDKGVALVPGTAFGPFPNHIRISLTEEESKLKRGIEILLDNI